MKNTNNVAADTALMSEADLKRLEQMRNVPIESVADRASMIIMAATLSHCVKELSIKSDDEKCHILEAAFQLIFMLGRASALQ
jgi:hypothetical protein